MKLKRLQFDKDGFSNYVIVSKDTIADGNCFFHSLLLILSKRYRDGNRNEKIMYIKEFKYNLGARFNIDVYKSLSRGNMVEYSKSIIEFTNDYTYLSLKTKFYDDICLVGEELLEYISNQLDMNIIILDNTTKSVYNITSIDLLIRDRKTMMILFIDNCHYEPVYLIRDNQVVLCFNYNDEFVQFVISKYKI